MAKVPGSTVELLTDTSKMPCQSWSIPAVKSCPGAYFAEGAICGENKEHTSCYATRSAYVWSTTVNAQNKRYQWLLKCLTTSDGIKHFISVMVRAIGSRRKNRQWFRVHDSGDLFNPKYIAAWYDICSALPDVQFWFPTRSYRIARLLPHLQRLNNLPNVTVRPSALHFGDVPPTIEGLSAGTSAAKDGYNCPAHMQNNECRDCRRCWSKELPVIYRAH